MFPAKVVAFGMNPAICKFLPFEIMELLFCWLHLLVLMKFKLVYRQWCIVLENPLFLVTCDRWCEKELGFISLAPCFPNHFLLASYLNNSGRLSTMVFHFLHFAYRIECTLRSMILFSTPGSYLHTKNYFIINHPFTKMFRNVGVLSVGEQWFFSLL